MFISKVDKTHQTQLSHITKKRIPKDRKQMLVLENEDKLFKNFKNYETREVRGNVTHAEFHPKYLENPNTFVLTHSNVVEFFDGNARSTKFNMFEGEAFSGTFRPSDGELIAAGSEEGRIKLFRSVTNARNKTALRDIKIHTGPVRLVRFLHGNGDSLLSCSDDKSFRVYNFLTEKTVFKKTQLADYMRAGCAFEDNSDMVAVGGYDHLVKVFDVRQKNQVMDVNHEKPVEYLIKHPKAPLLLSAGGNQILVWDMLKMGEPIYRITDHQNTVTGLRFNTQGTLLLSCSLDKNVNFYDAGSYSLKHQLTAKHSILSLDISKDEKQLITGLVSGKYMKSIRQDVMKRMLDIKHDDLSTSNFKNLIHPNLNDQVLIIQDQIYLPKKRTKHVHHFSTFLKTFKYKEALDDALSQFFDQPIIVLSLIEELKNRNELLNALDARDEVTLLPALKFIVKYLRDHRFTQSILSLFNTILSIYGQVVGQSTTIDMHLKYIRKLINEELNMNQQLFALKGILDMIMLSAAASNTSNTPTTSTTTEQDQQQQQQQQALLA